MSSVIVPQVRKRQAGSASFLSEETSAATVTAHESVYRTMRERILIGGFPPGMAVTLRGLADMLGVSVMPVRDAVRRLIAERALTMQDNRRVRVPEMTR